MIFLREASEDEMILEFLKGEINSERFQSQIINILDRLNVSSDIIEKADLYDSDENQKRKEILRIFRGYGSNKHLFENYSNEIRWTFARYLNCYCMKAFYINMRYL